MITIMAATRFVRTLVFLFPVAMKAARPDRVETQRKSSPFSALHRHTENQLCARLGGDPFTGQSVRGSLGRNFTVCSRSACEVTTIGRKPSSTARVAFRWRVRGLWGEFPFPRAADSRRPAAQHRRAPRTRSRWSRLLDIRISGR